MTTNLPSSSLPSPFSGADIAPAPKTALEAWNTPIFGDFAPPNVMAEPASDSTQVISPENAPAVWKQKTTEQIAPAQVVPALVVPAQTSPVQTTHVDVVSSTPASVEVAPITDSERTPEEMLEQIIEGLSPSRRSINAPSAHHAATSAVLPPVEVAPPREYRFKRGETSEIWGVKLDRIRMDETVEAIEEMIIDRVPRYVITANLNYAMLNAEDKSLKTVTEQASLVLADGQPLVWRSRIGSAGRLPERVAGSELIYRLAERAAKRGWRIYFLGAEPGVAQRCADRLAKKYPKLKIAGVQSPPYRKQTEAEQQAQRDAIIESRADILLVAFGQPKGERWIHEHYQELGVPVSIQVGASFDFVAGTAKRAPKVWQCFGMEWCYRMMSNPSRLVPRYASNAWFLLLALTCDWRDFVNAKYGTNS